MKPSRVPLVVTGLLFAGWVGWLIYLAVTTTRPVVLSRPQFYAADLYVLADLRAADKDPQAPAARVTVREVVWPAGGEDLKGKAVEIRNLPACGPAYGWSGKGEYILPLTRFGAAEQRVYVVTPIPRSPGYYGSAPTPQRPLPGRIYPVTAQARRELQDLIVEFHPH